ncbi:uncharacterized protein UV8b_05234 [Ustilaginoidea virens]|uniref:Uncharacterized protein n=1 Tax=Ustilaginoidea virens TaxID=1159556 RepID=A0A063CAW6_USTVR|nr:uncharacterized protein UV8b_05234 [Ustilaginoidea virens]QUC20993.1 hypothetical protein UV8b_05234 [Ustilaginoidea virens]GAO19334.1 hypothetical protein UVI_02008640 [Ustilaginoidea virens]
MGVAVRPFKASLSRKIRPVLVCVSLLLLVGFVGFERWESRWQYALPLGLEAALPQRLRVPPPCRPDLEHLRRVEYNLTRQIVYQKRCVTGLRDPAASRDVVASEPRPLLDAAASRVLDLRSACDGSLPQDAPCDAITLQVPPPFPAGGYAEFLFGVASSSERLSASVPQFRHWLGGTKARLLAVVTDTDFSPRRMSRLAAQFERSGIRFIGARPDDPSVGVNELHFVAVRHLLRHAAADTRWGVIIDDDTFFPSLHPVARELAKLDASTPAYVGALSENKDAVDFHGYMAYGGGGIFLSVPLLKLLEPNVEACLNESRIREGDGMLKYCVDDKTAANFTQVQGLHQLDFSGDLAGFYESGKWPLSLHHWKSWHKAPVDKIAQVSHFCGPCLFQRWRFGPDTVLANGYSIAVYSKGTADLQLDRMEATFLDSGAGQDWEWSLGPMREKLPKSEKKSYLLIDAEVVGRHLRQVYVYRPEPSSPPSEDAPKDEVVELWWDWK